MAALILQHLSRLNIPLQRGRTPFCRWRNCLLPQRVMTDAPVCMQLVCGLDDWRGCGHRDPWQLLQIQQLVQPTGVTGCCAGQWHAGNLHQCLLSPPLESPSGSCGCHGWHLMPQGAIKQPATCQLQRLLPAHPRWRHICSCMVAKCDSTNQHGSRRGLWHWS